MTYQIPQDIMQPSAAQPTVVYINRASHSIPLRPHKNFVCDKIAFTCPLHPVALDDEDAEIEDADGQFVQGHDVVLLAHAGAPYILPRKIRKVVCDKKHQHVKECIKTVPAPMFIYGYTISGTTITILPQVICKCEEIHGNKPSEELKQETGEIYRRNMNFKGTYASEQPLIAVVRELRAQQI